MSRFAEDIPSILMATLGDSVIYLKGERRFEIDGIPSKSLERSGAEGEALVIDELSISIDRADIEDQVARGDRIIYMDKIYDIQYSLDLPNGLSKLFLIEATDAAES